MSGFSEFLDDEELATLVGYRTARKQIDWLARNGWEYAVNAARKPVVSRLYTRLKLAGVTPAVSPQTPEAWSLDLSRVS